MVVTIEHETTNAGAGRFIMSSQYPSFVWRGINMIQARSGATAAPVNHVAQAIVNIIARYEAL